MTTVLDAAALLAIVALSATIVFAYLSSVRQDKSVGKPLPRLPGMPLLGSALSMSPRYLLETIRNATQQLGSMYEIYVLSKRIVVIGDAAVAKEVLSMRPKFFRRGRDLARSFFIMSERPAISMFSAEGEEWMKLRRLMAPGFSLRNLNLKTSTIVAEAFEIVERLQRQASCGAPVNMVAEAYNMTTRTITQVAMGTHGTEVEYFYGEEFANDLSTSIQLNAEYMFFPYPYFMWRLSPQYYKLEVAGKAANCNITKHINAVIDARRKMIGSTGLDTGDDACKENGTMLDVLIRHHDDEGVAIPITDEELLDNVRMLYAAGSETTAITISWALYFLSLDESICTRIRNEADHYFINGAEELRNMGYVASTLRFTTAVIKETLRLRSPVSYLNGETVSDTEGVELSNGVVINPKDQFLVDIDSILCDETVFKNGNQFNPDRWLTEDEAALADMELHFLSFGSGRRVCPGMGLAHAEAAIVIATLLHYFDFELACSPADVKRTLAFISTRCEKLPMFVRPRLRAYL